MYSLCADCGDRPAKVGSTRCDLCTEYVSLLDEYIQLRKTMVEIYNRAGSELWKSRRRADTAGHVCDYRNALQAVKFKAKTAIGSTKKRVRK